LLKSILAQNIISAFVKSVRKVHVSFQRQLHTFAYLFDGAEVINDAYIKVEET